MDVLTIIQKCEFGDRFRRALFFAALILVFFHLFCLVAPLLEIFPKFAAHLQAFSSTLSNLTVALVLMYLLVEGQKNLHVSAVRRRQRCYAAIGGQIEDWFDRCQSPLFDPAVVMPESAAFDALQNFKVAGAPARVLTCYPQFQAERAALVDYCDKVHFELTNYPGEMIYGVHFEFADPDLNLQLCQALREQLNLDQQSREFKIDCTIPKRPGWIFLTRTIDLPADPEAGFALNLTHSRHFVELVGHAYDVLYGEPMLEAFLGYRANLGFATPAVA